jgi:hypothetical protein
MSLWAHLLRSLLLPGFLTALVAGALIRGLAAWLAAQIGGRPASPPWQPLEEIVHLAGKAPPGRGQPQALASWPALFALVALSWGLGMLPWPRWLLTEELPVNLVVYLLLLTVPPLARLAAAGLSALVPAAIGARRQAPVEIARLLPVLLAGSALPLLSGQLTLAPTVALSPWSTIVGLTVAGVFLVTLPWPLWDHDAHDAPLAGLGGRTLALYRGIEALELAAQTGLVAVALRTSGLFPPAQEGLPLVVALVVVLGALTVFESVGRRPLLPESAQLYTRWILPVAAVVAVVAWWFGA